MSLVCFIQLFREGVNYIMIFSSFVVGIGLIRGLLGVINSGELKHIHICSYSILMTILSFPSLLLTVLTFDI